MTRPNEGAKSTNRLFRTGSNSRELFWGGVSQGASSLTNLGLSLAAARALGPEGLGVVFVGFSLYLALLSLQRALLSDPLVALTTGQNDEERFLAQRSTLTILVVVSTGIAALTFLAGLIIPDPIGGGLIAFSPWLLPALLQDFWRVVLFQQRRGRAGAANDLSWLLVMAAGAPLAFKAGGLVAIVSWWGLGATAGSILGFFQTRLRLTAGSISARWWRRTGWPLGRWFGLDSLVLNLTAQSLVFGLAFLLGPVALGGLRAVQTVYAPLSVISTALVLPALPEIARRLRESASKARQYVVRLGVLAGTLTATYMGLVSLLGDDLLTRVFGHEFSGFESLVWPVGTNQLMGAAFIGFPILLKGQQRGRALLTGTVIGSVVMLGSSVTFAMNWGIVGASWGVALGAGVKNVLKAVFATRESSPASPSRVE